MIEKERTNDGAAPSDSATGGAGDVETAGETTAADTIGGPPDTRPVRPDLSFEVADAPDRATDDKD